MSDFYKVYFNRATWDLPEKEISLHRHHIAVMFPKPLCGTWLLGPGPATLE
jgi:hypothetical protein